ncbi:MAG: redox-regulated ATPase YchF [Alphaproteobacteria bacterium]
MGFKCGIVGLPNVGKSTLFNALNNEAAAEAANYPFCTIEPNVGLVPVPDPRLDALADIATSKKIIHTQLEFVDIAGLVRGASKGEGLGNQFLSHIREVDAIIHVLRCFEDGNITHVEGDVDPIRDAEIIETELMLSDMESLERQKAKYEKKASVGEKEAKEVMAVITPIMKALEEGKPARTVEVTEAQKPLFKLFGLLTSKPILYVCNVEEDAAAEGNSQSEKVQKMAAEQGAKAVIVSAAIEAEVSGLTDPAERQEFLETLGLSETGLSRVIRAGYELLDLITFFTIGPKEARAWTVRKGSTAPQSAGEIHTDFERGFICAETIAYDDYVSCKGEQGAKESGKLRQEGKTYITQNGDVFHFRFNV